MVIFSLMVATAVYFDTKNYNTQKKNNDMAIADNVFESNINFEKISLLQTVVAIKSNTEYIKIFKEGDRQKLLKATEGLFGELKNKHNITHFYFITPDKKCFLRVHKPQQYGDIINRVTLAKAIERQQEFSALEMGKNFFSLRAVSPIFDNGRLLGYVEIGREIDHFFGLFKKQTGFDVSLLLDKKYVERYAIVSDTKLAPSGKTVGEFVILNSSNSKLAESLINAQKEIFGDISIGDKNYFCYSKEIYDVSGEKVGKLLVSSDNTEIYKAASRQYVFIIILTLVAVLLMGYIVKVGIDREILRPLEKIRNGVVGFFDFIRGDANTVEYIEPMQNNEIGSIANTLNASMEETVQILDENRKNEAYLLQKSRVIALGEMISNIAHHWRQPLNAISIAAQDMRYAKADGELSDKYLEDSISNIVETSRHLSITLDRFGQFYKEPKNKDDFCVEDEIARTVEFFRDIHTDFEAKEIAIDFSTKHKHMIKNYKNELAQAVLNILRNSQEAIVGRNIENGLITIGVSQTQDSIEINILDNGGGVEDGQMEKIFDPYYTTKYKANDVGLGLYLSKMMVEKNMGGTLTAQNYQDGLKMQIRLPLAHDSNRSAF
jgi:two-component system, NtrC family, C4-dicarboxylate transport sensor histidine kinase DctB